MNYLSIQDVSKSFGDKVVFENISFGMDKGQKTALVGINGSGKSTLLKIIFGQDGADTGEVSFRNDIKVAFLSQNPEMSAQDTVLEAIFDQEDEILNTIKDYKFHLAKSEMSGGTQNDLGALIEKMDSLSAWDYESQISQVLGKLGIYELDRKIGTLSGGQVKRVALAKNLVHNPDFLILDEPTNHLDLDTIEWLENYLGTSNMTLLLVTHDRYFLDRVCNDIIELDQSTIFRCKGNYSQFLIKKAERQEQMATEVEKAKNLMRKELDWMRRQPKARGTKAKYRIDAFHELKDKASTNLRKDEMKLEVAGNRQGRKIMEIDKLSKAFDDKKLIEDFSYIFQKGERIGIIGKNGTGKSTFLNLITQKLQPDSGTIDYGSTTKFGYYTQQEPDFSNSKKVIDVITEIADVITVGKDRTISASQFLNHFQFPPKVQHNPVSKLSGGEKRRLQLMQVLVTNPNFLILDEPTNDLDLVTLNILEDFLASFEGCLILVSHDRYFMDKLVEHLFVFEGEGKIKDFPGNYADYRLTLTEAKEKEKEQVAAKPKEKKEKEKAKLSFNEKREYEALEREIEELEQQKAILVEKLNSGESDHQLLTDWSQKIESIAKAIEEKSDRWLVLSEFAE